MLQQINNSLCLPLINTHSLMARFSRISMHKRTWYCP